MCASAHLPPKAKKGCWVLPGTGHSGALGPSTATAAPGQAAWPRGPWPEAPGEPGAACSPAGSDRLSMLCSFQLLAHPDVGEDDSGALRHLQRLLNNPNQVIYSLVLSALLPASGTPVTVSRAHFCEGRWAFVLKVSWPAPGQLGGLCPACSSVAQKKWPRNELATEGPSGSLGSFPCMPWTFWGGSERGHRVFAQLPSFSSCCLCASKMAAWCSGTTGFWPGWPFIVSPNGNSVLPPGKKTSRAAARHHSGPAGCQG